MYLDQHPGYAHSTPLDLSDMKQERSSQPLETVRLDRWIWAARLFKTRTLAAEAIDGGKVHVNGKRVKRSRLIVAGDLVRVSKPPYEFTMEVTGLSERRGPAPVAQSLYRESAESLAARERLRTQLAHQPRVSYEGKGRPTKKDRRKIDRLKHG